MNETFNVPSTAAVAVAARGSAKYVDCQCVACGWLDGFKAEAITQGMVGGWCDTCGRETVFRVSKPEENKYATMQDLAVCSFINASRMAEAGHLKQAYMEAESGQRQLKAAIDAISPNDKLSHAAGDRDVASGKNK